MIDFFANLLSTQGFPDRWHCGTWTAGHGWLHISADVATWAAYTTIPCLLAYFILQRRDLPFPRIFWLFGAFILACGTVHLIEATIFWWPVYRLSGLVKLITAVASWATVIALVPIVPKALALRNPHELEREIADRRRAEDALRESEAQYQTLVESLPLNVFRKDLNSRIVFANQKFCETIGRHLDDVVGKTDADLFPRQFADKYQRDDARVIAEGKTLEDFEEHRRPDGELIYVQVFKAPIRDAQGVILGVQGMFWDVSKRKRAEKELQRSNARFRRLVESNIIGIIVVDLEGGINEANDAFLAMVGYSREDLQSGVLRWDKITPQEFRHLDERAVNQLRTSGTCPPWEKEYVRKDGGRVPVLLGVTLVEEASDVAICFVVDITQRKQAERDLKRQAEELAHSNAELEQFAYVASHDLQEPLRAVSGYCQLLQRRYEGKLDAEADEFIEFVVDGAARMQTLINDLLIYARVGTQGKPFESTDCSAVFAQAVVNLRAAIQESGAVVSQSGLPTVMADRSQLVQLFQNLIGNAIKFHGDRPPEVAVEATSQDGGWLFRVRDNGIGIDHRHRDRIFAVFQQLHTRQQYPGTGIGLAICKKIVQRHGGRLGVESQPDKGSVFHFTIPTEEQPHES